MAPWKDNKHFLHCFRTPVSVTFLVIWSVSFGSASYISVVVSTQHWTSYTLTSIHKRYSYNIELQYDFLLLVLGICHVCRIDSWANCEFHLKELSQNCMIWFLKCLSLIRSNLRSKIKTKKKPWHTKMHTYMRY